jgi:hypothetical protein
VELEILYFVGLRQNYGERKTLKADGTLDYYNYQRKGYSFQLRGIPSLVVQAPEGTKFQPFARFGVIIPFYGRTMLEENFYKHGSTLTATTPISENNIEKITEVEGKFSIGFEASIGLKYNINNNLGVYVQATYTGLRIRSDKAHVIVNSELDPDGNLIKDHLTEGIISSRTISKEIEFQDVMDENSNISTALSAFYGDFPEDIIIELANSSLDFDKPLNLPTQTSNFNSISFTLGVQYTFGKNKIIL